MVSSLSTTRMWDGAEVGEMGKDGAGLAVSVLHEDLSPTHQHSPVIPPSFSLRHVAIINATKERFTSASGALSAGASPVRDNGTSLSGTPPAPGRKSLRRDIPRVHTSDASIQYGAIRRKGDEASSEASDDNNGRPRTSSGRLERRRGHRRSATADMDLGTQRQTEAPCRSTGLSASSSSEVSEKADKVPPSEQPQPQAKADVDALDGAVDLDAAEPCSPGGSLGLPRAGLGGAAGAFPPTDAVGGSPSGGEAGGFSSADAPWGGTGHPLENALLAAAAEGAAVGPTSGVQFEEGDGPGMTAEDRELLCMGPAQGEPGGGGDSHADVAEWLRRSAALQDYGIMSRSRSISQVARPRTAGSLESGEPRVIPVAHSLRSSPVRGGCRSIASPCDARGSERHADRWSPASSIHGRGPSTEGLLKERPATADPAGRGEGAGLRLSQSMPRGGGTALALLLALECGGKERFGSPGGQETASGAGQFSQCRSLSPCLDRRKTEGGGARPQTAQTRTLSMSMSRERWEGVMPRADFTNAELVRPVTAQGRPVKAESMMKLLEAQQSFSLARQESERTLLRSFLEEEAHELAAVRREIRSGSRREDKVVVGRIGRKALGARRVLAAQRSMSSVKMSREGSEDEEGGAGEGEAEGAQRMKGLAGQSSTLSPRTAPSTSGKSPRGKGSRFGEARSSELPRESPKESTLQYGQQKSLQVRPQTSGGAPLVAPRSISLRGSRSGRTKSVSFNLRDDDQAEAKPHGHEISGRDLLKMLQEDGKVPRREGQDGHGDSRHGGREGQRPGPPGSDVTGTGGHDKETEGAQARSPVEMGQSSLHRHSMGLGGEQQVQFGQKVIWSGVKVNVKGGSMGRAQVSIKKVKRRKRQREKQEVVGGGADSGNEVDRADRKTPARRTLRVAVLWRWSLARRAMKAGQGQISAMPADAPREGASTHSVDLSAASEASPKDKARAPPVTPVDTEAQEKAEGSDSRPRLPHIIGLSDTELEDAVDFLYLGPQQSGHVLQNSSRGACVNQCFVPLARTPRKSGGSSGHA